MEERNVIVQLASDIFKGKVNKNFTNGEDKDEQMEVLRAALVEANGGSTKINYRKLKRNP